MSSSVERHVGNDPAAAAGELALAAQVAHSPEQLALAAHSIATTPEEKAELEVGELHFHFKFDFLTCLELLEQRASERVSVKVLHA